MYGFLRCTLTETSTNDVRPMAIIQEGTTVALAWEMHNMMTKLACESTQVISVDRLERKP